MLYYQGDHTRDDLPRRFLRATILTLFYNNVASCDALNILPFNSASSILGDPGTISRVGRNGGESFQFVLYPIDLPWVSQGFHFIRITLLRWSHTRRSATTIFRATILALFCNNVASCDARNILPFNSASSIHGDSGTVSRVGRNGGFSICFIPN